VWRSVKAGALGGFLGGTVSGIVLAVAGRDLLFQLAQLIGVSSAPAGFVVYLVGSAAVGALFGVLLRDSVSNPTGGAVLGVVYGAAVWLIGPMTPLHAMHEWWARYAPQLLVTPLPLRVTAMSHGIYGVLLGASYSLFFGETEAASAAGTAPVQAAEVAAPPSEDVEAHDPRSAA